MDKNNRIALIGDIGGHWEELYSAVVGLGADPETCRLPVGLTVIQVGDLIHKGPASEDVIAFVQERLAQNSEGCGQWIQLIGNHEAHHLDGPVFPEGSVYVLAQEAEDIMCNWWQNGQMHVAASLRTRGGLDVLVTHAGLTAGAWVELGEPQTALKAQRVLNDPTNHDIVWREDGYLMGGPDNLHAGPMYAHCSRELYRSLDIAALKATPVPFAQVHGHSSPYVWNNQRFDRACDPPPRKWRIKLDPETRIAKLHPGAWPVWSIDPSLGSYGHKRWAPLVFPQAELLV